MQQNNGDGSSEARGMAVGTGVDEKKTKRRKSGECAAGGKSWDSASAVREAKVTQDAVPTNVKGPTISGTSIANLADMNGIPGLRLPAERRTTGAAIGPTSPLDVGLPKTTGETGDAILLNEKHGASGEAERWKPSPTRGRRERGENATWTRSLPRWTPKSSGRSTRIGQSGES